MEFVLNCFKGIIIGAGAILPGISSGVFCVIFGIYEKIINSILYFFKDIRNNIIFLFPILVGMSIGIVIFGNILQYLFYTFPIQTNFCFMGLILGSVKSLVKNANLKKGFRLHYIIYTIISFSIAVFLLYLEKHFSSTYLIEKDINFLYLVFCGFIMSVGVVVPGISSSVLLMILGVYNTYLLAISSINLNILIPIGIGLVIGGYIFLIVIKYLLSNFYSQTYYSIIGFVLGSTLILYHDISFDFNGITSFIIFVISFYSINKFENHVL